MLANTTVDYPKVVPCRNHLTVVIKPLDLQGVPAQLEMLRALPPSEQALLPCDVMDPEYATTLRDQVKTGSVQRLVAWHGNQEIVGALAMYPGNSRWIAHTARLVVAVHPDYRRTGIAHVLLDEVLTLAEQHGIRKVYCELTDMHQDACKLVKAIGFQREAVFKDHMRDEQGEYHKLAVFSLDVDTASLLLTQRLFQYVRMDYKV